MVIRPVLSSYEPVQRVEILRRLMPRFLRVVIGSALITVTAGSLVGFYRTGFSFVPFITIPWGYAILTGAMLSLIMLLLGIGIALPESKRFVSSLESGSNPKEVSKSLMRIQMVTKVNLVLAVIVVFTMAFAVFSFQL